MRACTCSSEVTQEEGGDALVKLRERSWSRKVPVTVSSLSRPPWRRDAKWRGSRKEGQLSRAYLPVTGTMP